MRTLRMLGRQAVRQHSGGISWGAAISLAGVDVMIIGMGVLLCHQHIDIWVTTTKMHLFGHII